MILKYLDRKSWAMVALCAVFILIQVFFDLQIPSYMNDMTMALQTGSDLGAVSDYGLKMALCAFASLAAAIGTVYMAAKVGSTLGRNLRLKLFDKIKTFTPQDTVKFSSASLITRTTNDVVQVQTFAAMALSIIIKAPIMAVWALSRISGGSWEWTAATAAGLLAIAASVGYILWITRPYYKRIPPLTDDINRHTKDHVSSVRVVRAYNAEEFQDDSFKSTSERLRDNDLYIWKRTALLPPISSGVSDFLTLAIYWIGTLLIAETYGIGERQQLFSDMIVFSSYGLQVLMAFILVSHIIQESPRALVSSKRVQEVLSHEPAIDDGVRKDGDGSTGKVEFRDVGFEYPGTREKALDGVSFTAEKGQTVAIVGPTGCGKTTLVSLIPRLYKASSGQVLVDGVDVREYERKSLGAKLGYVPQSSVTFAGTIRSNVAFGDMAKKATDEDVMKALETAQAAEFVNDLDEGVDTVVQQGGRNLSGGQRQRLSIARAICRKPEIFVLDDSFSALDFKTDKAVREALKKNAAGSTFIIVAQRIGTIMDADLIVVLDEGKVVGRGKHSELMRTCDLYREMAESQMPEELL